MIHNSALKFRVLRLLRKPFQCSSPPFKLRGQTYLSDSAPGTVDNAANFSLYIQDAASQHWSWKSGAALRSSLPSLQDPDEACGTTVSCPSLHAGQGHTQQHTNTTMP